MKELSQTLKLEFVKFYNLPFPMVEYNFDYYLSALDPYHNTLSKYKEFVNFIEEMGGEDQFLKEKKSAKESVIDLLKNDFEECNSPIESLKHFNFSEYQAINYNIKSNDVYKIPNVGNHYISIDLKHANFQSLRFISDELKSILGKNPLSNIIDNCSSYECLFSMANVNPYFAKSKPMRQYIFGLLEPKYQQNIQKYIMGKVIDKLLSSFNSDCIVALNSDELIIRVDEKDIEKKKEIINLLISNDIFLSRFQFHLESFQLCRVGTEHKFFYKKSGNIIEFKCVPKNKLMEVIAKYEGRAATQEERTFMLDGRLAIFQDSLF